jgi:hypothetical protein
VLADPGVESTKKDPALFRNLGNRTFEELGKRLVLA